MATHRRLQFVRAQVAVMMGAVLVLAPMGWLTIETFFVIAYLGFLVIIELTPPFTANPPWRRRLLWLVLGGLGVFGYIVITRILEILPPGVVS